MIERALTLLKTVAVMVVAGGVVVASFYMAYIIITLVVLVVIGCIAYLFFNWDRIVDWYETDD